VKKSIVLFPVLAVFAALALAGCPTAPPAAPPPVVEAPPEQPPAEAPPVVVPVVLPIVTVHFGPNVADFTGIEADVAMYNERALMEMAHAFNMAESVTLRIEGHANPITPPGTAERAAEQSILQALSAARANAALERLVELGVDRARLTAVGLGYSQILVDFEDRDNWWRNRRAHIIPVW
jgi:outer membrane protein OmpA-like peptidoglycan-associated protein